MKLERKISCSSWDIKNQKMVDTSFESSKCGLWFEISNTSKVVRISLGKIFESDTISGKGVIT